MSSISHHHLHLHLLNPPPRLTLYTSTSSSLPKSPTFFSLPTPRPSYFPISTHHTYTPLPSLRLRSSDSDAALNFDHLLSLAELLCLASSVAVSVKFGLSCFNVNRVRIGVALGLCRLGVDRLGWVESGGADRQVSGRMWSTVLLLRARVGHWRLGSGCSAVFCQVRGDGGWLGRLGWRWEGCGEEEIWLLLVMPAVRVKGLGDLREMSRRAAERGLWEEEVRKIEEVKKERDEEEEGIENWEHIHKKKKKKAKRKNKSNFYLKYRFYPW